MDRLITKPYNTLGQGLAGRATNTTPLVLDCFYIDFDGNAHGPRPARFIIPEYMGARDILSLDVHPAQFAPDVEDVRSYLQRRGKRFVETAQGMHKEYDGRTLPKSIVSQLQEEKALNRGSFPPGTQIRPFAVRYE
jgi:hypothetical protein